MAIKDGIIEFVISISIVVIPAHCPASGVNVYVVIPTAPVFITAGFQVPVMDGRLFEALGKLGADTPKHNGPIAVNTGVIEFVISMSKVAIVAHCPASGVKV